MKGRALCVAIIIASTLLVTGCAGIPSITCTLTFPTISCGGSTKS